MGKSHGPDFQGHHAAHLKAGTVDAHHRMEENMDIVHDDTDSDIDRLAVDMDIHGYIHVLI